MAAPPIQDEMLIEDLETATFLADPANLEYLGGFMVDDKSAAEIAQELGISKSLMSYWVKKLLKHGLVRRLRVEKRGKHNVPIYRAVAKVFLVPLDVLVTDPNKDIFDDAAFERTLKRSLIHFKHQSVKGRFLRYGADVNSTVPVFKVVPPRHSQALADYFGWVSLTQTQANQLYEETLRLWQRFVEESSEDGEKKYLFKLAMVEQWPQ